MCAQRGRETGTAEAIQGRADFTLPTEYAEAWINGRLIIKQIAKILGVRKKVVSDAMKRQGIDPKAKRHAPTTAPAPPSSQPAKPRTYNGKKVLVLPQDCIDAYNARRLSLADIAQKLGAEYKEVARALRRQHANMNTNRGPFKAERITIPAAYLIAHQAGRMPVWQIAELLDANTASVRAALGRQGVETARITAERQARRKQAIDLYAKFGNYSLVAKKMGVSKQRIKQIISDTDPLAPEVVRAEHVNEVIEACRRDRDVALVARSFPSPHSETGHMHPMTVWNLLQTHAIDLWRELLWEEHGGYENIAHRNRLIFESYARTGSKEKTAVELGLNPSLVRNVLWNNYEKKGRQFTSRRARHNLAAMLAATNSPGLHDGYGTDGATLETTVAERMAEAAAGVGGLWGWERGWEC